MWTHCWKFMRLGNNLCCADISAVTCRNTKGHMLQYTPGFYRSRLWGEWTLLLTFNSRRSYSMFSVYRRCTDEHYNCKPSSKCNIYSTDGIRGKPVDMKQGAGASRAQSHWKHPKLHNYYKMKPSKCADVSTNWYLANFFKFNLITNSKLQNVSIW